MFSLYSFSLPFTEPFRTPVTTITRRDGLILRYGDHYAEASPLPGFSPDTIEQVIRRYTDNSETLTHFFDSEFDYDALTNLVKDFTGLPSLQFALSMLGFKILNNRNKPADTIAGLFDKDSSGVAVNEVAGTDVTIDQVRSQVKEGATVIKFKVGSEPGNTADLLHSLHRQFPDLQFRLDANRSWPAGRVNEFSSLFKALPVQYIEEPAIFSGTNELQNLLKICELPVALDDSIQSLQVFKEYSALNDEKITAYIIKPTFFGDIPGLFETISRQHSLVDKVVCTSAFESTAGLADIRRMAAAYGSKTLAHGLGTGRFFSSNFCRTLPETFGDLNPELLELIGN